MSLSNFYRSKIAVITLGGLLLIVPSLGSCQSKSPIALTRLEAKGHVKPRNYREKIIFDYFQAVQAEHYDYAYSLISPKVRGHYIDFVTDLKINRRFLPTAIAIGEEFAAEDGTYGYIIYQLIADTTTINHGHMLLVPSTQQPGTWYIAYSSLI